MAQGNGDAAVEGLLRHGHVNARAFLQGCQHVGTVNNLREMGRPDLFLPLGDEDQVDRRLASGSAEGVQGSQECGFGAVLRNSRKTGRPRAA